MRLVFLRLRNDLGHPLLGLLTNVSHESLRIALAFGNTLQLLLPTCCHIRASQLANNELNQLLPLAGRHQLVLSTRYRVCTQQLLNNISSCRRRSQAMLLHTGEQRCFRKACRWQRAKLTYPALLDRQGLPERQRRKQLCWLAIGLTRAFAVILIIILRYRRACARLVDFLPALILLDSALRVQPILADSQNDACLIVAVRSVKQHNKSSHDQIIQPPLIRAEGSQVHELLRRDNRMVIGNLAVIHYTFCDRQLRPKEPARKLRIGTHRNALQTSLKRRHHIAGQIT
ncbi:hypothetical protein D3C78_1196150 [compost metagenome]